ncbi:MAG TPA: hypothetical protein V6D09_12915 [Leptolyngbyaceae cyanobacterium]
MKHLIAAALMFSLAGSSSPVFAKIECDRSICVNYSTAKWVHSKVPGAPSYKVKQFQGKRIFSNGNNPAVMEIDCRKHEFRTVKIKEQGKWFDFDPRWGADVSDWPVASKVCTGVH